jgi:hypothetical protein
MFGGAIVRNNLVFFAAHGKLLDTLTSPTGNHDFYLDVSANRLYRAAIHQPGFVPGVTRPMERQCATGNGYHQSDTGLQCVALDAPHIANVTVTTAVFIVQFTAPVRAGIQ